MEIIGYIATFFIGFILGLIGGGGAILAVPVLVYLFLIDTYLATSYSLAIVGVTALFGTISNYFKSKLEIKVALKFLLAASISVFIMRAYILPLVPEYIQLLDISKSKLLITTFAIFMLIASFFMLKPQKLKQVNRIEKFATLKLIIAATFTGIISAGVGAGGGFMIVPVLHILAGLDMKKAVATSMLIISINSLIGFVGDISTGMEIDFYFIGSLILVALLGLIPGLLLNQHFKTQTLKKVFGIFVLCSSVFILFKEFWNN